MALVGSGNLVIPTRDAKRSAGGARRNLLALNDAEIVTVEAAWKREGTSGASA